MSSEFSTENELSKVTSADPSEYPLDTPENILQELIVMATHCEKAAEQLRELIDVPALTAIESAANIRCDAGDEGESDVARTSCIAPSISLANFEKIKRISRAAEEGFLLDHEDLLAILQAERITNNNLRLEELETELKRLLLSNQQERDSPQVVSHQTQLLSEIIEIREPLRCYEEAARIAQESVDCVKNSAQRN